MANLNLSEFTEKLFVADADHTFIWDSAMSISKRVSRNSWLNSGTLTSDAPVTISQTWNQIGTAFTAFKVNAVSTASASGSLLLDLQVGGVSQFTVRKDGAIVLPFGYAGIIDGSVNGGGTNYTWGGPRFGPTAFIAWTATSPAGTADTILLRDGAANTLALRNGAAAQTFRVYNTYTDASNYERAIFSFNSNRLEISTGQAGAGVSRKIDFGTNGATGITFFTNTTNRWGIGSDGHFVAAADNSYDIGASGANRPRDIYAGTSVRAGNRLYAGNGGVEIGNTAYFYWGNRSMISSPADSLILFQNVANTDFNRLQLGGTTNLFPAIKRNGAGLQIRLADDSANATLEAGNLYASGNVGIGTTAPGSALTISGAMGTNTSTYDSASALKLTNTAGISWLLTSGVIGIVNASFCIRRESVALPALTIAHITDNVGIGTTSPTSKLDVAGAVTAAGYFTATSGGVSLVANGLWQQGTGHLTLASGAILGWSGQANVNIDQPGDTRLLRDEAYHLALRNGTLGQKFSVYGTYPGAAWERFTITAPTSGNVLLGTYKGTGGIARGLELQADGTTRMLITAAGAIIQRPLASVTPPDNGDLVIEATSNTTLTFKLKGTDGTVRTGTITLA